MTLRVKKKKKAAENEPACFTLAGGSDGRGRLAKGSIEAVRLHGLERALDEDKCDNPSPRETEENVKRETLSK